MRGFLHRSYAAAKPLVRRATLTLWSGLAASATGDEVYRAALIWLAVRQFGGNAALLSSLEAATILLFALVVGRLIDRHDPRQMLVVAELFRGSVMIALLILTSLGEASFAAFAVAAVLIASQRAITYPAIQACIPRTVEDVSSLTKVNAFFDATLRLARIAGPSFIGLLAASVAVPWFFAISAVACFSSSLAAAALGKVGGFRAMPHYDGSTSRPADRRKVAAIVKDVPGTHRMLATYGAINGVWVVAVPTGVALLLTASGRIETYGIVMAVYGGANLLGTLILAFLSRLSSHRLFYIGATVQGLGIVSVGIGWLLFPGSLLLLALGAAVTAIGGPFLDVGISTTIQSRFALHEVARVSRYRLIFVWGSILVASAASAPLLDTFGAAPVIVGCGAIAAGVGLLGALRRA
ncbi:MAG: MFS transporter [Alphaproteobacteria bacterium]|nr:MFS transporter [Alphaproteobacteria bacterium]